MPRLPRITPIDLPVHVIQRGNNRQVCFVSDEDHGAYAGWLKAKNIPRNTVAGRVKSLSLTSAHSVNDKDLTP